MDGFEEAVRTMCDYFEDDRLPVVHFGRGDLLPLITKVDTGCALTIFRVDAQRPFEQATPEEQEKLLADGVPLVMLHFPHTDKGQNGVFALKEWTNTLDKKMKEQLDQIMKEKSDSLESI